MVSVVGGSVRIEVLVTADGVNMTVDMTKPEVKVTLTVSVVTAGVSVRHTADAVIVDVAGGPVIMLWIVAGLTYCEHAVETTLQAKVFKLDGKPLKVQTDAAGAEVVVRIEVVVMIGFVLLEVNEALLEVVEVRIDVVELRDVVVAVPVGDVEVRMGVVEVRVEVVEVRVEVVEGRVEVVEVRADVVDGLGGSIRLVTNNDIGWRLTVLERSKLRRPLA
jgi:hypothetical protein